MTPEQILTLKVVFLYVLPLIIILVSHIGEVNFEDSAIVAFIPGINILVAIFSIGMVLNRAFSSKGKCIAGHTYETIPGNDRQYKNRMTAPVGGIDRYACKDCGKTTSQKWTAF